MLKEDADWQEHLTGSLMTISLILKAQLVVQGRGGNTTTALHHQQLGNGIRLDVTMMTMIEYCHTHID